MGLYRIYLLVNEQFAIELGEMVSFPIQNGGSFQFVMCRLPAATIFSDKIHEDKTKIWQYLC